MTRMKTSVVLLTLSSVCLAAQAGTLLCGTRVISDGASSAEVGAACGEPTHVERSSMWRTIASSSGGQPNLLGSTSIEIHFETWLYNFGPDKLMQRISFEEGTVVRIESLGYGYVESP